MCGCTSNFDGGVSLLNKRRLGFDGDVESSGMQEDEYDEFLGLDKKSRQARKQLRASGLTRKQARQNVRDTRKGKVARHEVPTYEAESYDEEVVDPTSPNSPTLPNASRIMPIQQGGSGSGSVQAGLGGNTKTFIIVGAVGLIGLIGFLALRPRN